MYEPNHSSNMPYTRWQPVKPKRPKDLISKDKMLDKPDFGVQIPTSPRNVNSCAQLSKNAKQH